MPLELIPNQPYIFEQALPDQPCLNNDTRSYTQMVTADDTICVQQVMEACTPDVLCDSDMYLEGSELMTGAWAVFGGWSSADLNHIAYDGASHTPADYTSLNVAIVQGRAYKLTFEVTSITGEGGFYANLGIGLPENGVLYDAIGTYTSYFIGGSTGSLALYFQLAKTTPVAGDTVAITVTSLKQWADDCWDSEILITPLEYPFTYSFDENTLQGKFCSNASDRGGDLVNISAYATDGNYHRVKFTITDLTEGGIEVILGGDYLGTATENGEFSFYGVPTSGGELIFRKSPTFDGCISYVSVDDYGLLDNSASSAYKLEIINASNLAVGTDAITYEVWDDRIIWCFNISDLTNGGFPIELACTIDYKLKITEQCSAEVDPVEYISTTILRYNNAGWDCTFVVNGYSEGYAFGFYFGSTTAPAFYLTQRLRVLQFAPRYPATAEEYLYSNGSFARSFAQSGKIRSCWFDYVDEPTHDVIRLQLLSDVLTLDSDVYFAPVKDYEPEWDEHRYNLAQSRVDLVKEETLFNRSCDVIGQAPCTTNTVTTPPSPIIGYKIVGTFDLTNVDDANFDISEAFLTSYGTIASNDATTLGGRNAISTYLQSYITGAVIGVNGNVSSATVSYSAPILTIEIYGTGDYTSTYSSAAFMVDVTNIAANVITLQPY
jgi:hypothetical protein